MRQGFSYFCRSSCISSHITICFGGTGGATGGDAYWFGHYSDRRANCFKQDITVYRYHELSAVKSCGEIFFIFSFPIEAGNPMRKVVFWNILSKKSILCL